jgi:hypothetical protein
MGFGEWRWRLLLVLLGFTRTGIRSRGKKRICWRKSREREEIVCGVVDWRAASLAQAGERENRVSEEAILATRLVRLLKGWIRA